jgi:hypothetical protein
VALRRAEGNPFLTTENTESTEKTNVFHSKGHELKTD